LSHPKSDNESGFILVTVLILVMTISALLVVFLKTSFEANRELRVAEHVAKGRVLAKSGINRVFAAINDPSDRFEQLLLNKLGPHHWQFSDENLELNIESEAGKVDLNETSMELIGAYLLQLGLAPDHMRYVEEKLLAARTSDQQLELDAIYWPVLIYANWVDFHRNFTVRNPRGTIDINFVSADLLSAIPDIDENAVQSILLAREIGSALPAVNSMYLGSGGNVFTITSLVKFAPSRKFYMRLPIKTFSTGGAIALGLPHI